jgi:hypothetical protein
VGADARAFLNGQLTCDVSGLAPDGSTYGAYCTPKGRVLATVLLWSTPAGYLMQVPRALCEPVRKRLSMYILRSKVKASDVSAAHAQYGVAGPDAAALVAQIAGAVPQRPHGVAGGDRAMALRLPAERYLLVVPREHAAAASEALAAASLPEPESWWDGLDIAAGIASVVPETQEQFVPQMLNLDAVGGVSFNKGCYPGQEIVARMHFLGRLKERMVRARVSGPVAPRPGDKVYGVDLGAQAAGMIANVTPARDGGYDVLAVVQLSSVAAGPVRLGASDGPELTIEKLPYALPAK